MLLVVVQVVERKCGGKENTGRYIILRKALVEYQNYGITSSTFIACL